MVTKVVAPARTSRRTVVPRERSPKKVSSRDVFGAGDAMTDIIQGRFARARPASTGLASTEPGKLANRRCPVSLDAVDRGARPVTFCVANGVPDLVRAAHRAEGDPSSGPDRLLAATPTARRGRSVRW
jgi:hypothetical protein